jgi:hypothetical protein
MHKSRTVEDNPILCAEDGAIDLMKMSGSNHKTTRWAAYQNKAMDSASHGHLQFLAIGPHNTYQVPPTIYLVDTTYGLGWKYRFIGYVDMETGEIHGE